MQQKNALRRTRSEFKRHGKKETNEFNLRITNREPIISVSEQKENDFPVLVKNVNTSPPVWNIKKPGTGNDVISATPSIGNYIDNEPTSSNAVDNRIPQRIPYRKSVRNQLTKSAWNNSYETWERNYFKHLVDLRNIFVEGIQNFDIDKKINYDSVYFFENFSRFIRDSSTGEISNLLDELNDEEEKIYLKYIIKKIE